MFSRSSILKAFLFGVPMAASISVILRARFDAVDVGNPIFQLAMHTLIAVVSVLGLVGGSVLLWAASIDFVDTIKRDKDRSSFCSLAAFYYVYRGYPLAIAFGMFMTCTCGTLLRLMLTM